MKYFNKEQMEILTPHENNFTTAIHSDYVAFTSVYNHKRVVEIYEQTTGVLISHNYNCKACVLKNFKIIGELYFESKKYYENEQKQEEEASVDGGEVVEKSKKGSKKSKKSKKSEQ